MIGVSDKCHHGDAIPVSQQFAVWGGLKQHQRVLFLMQEKTNTDLSLEQHRAVTARQVRLQEQVLPPWAGHVGGTVDQLGGGVAVTVLHHRIWKKLTTCEKLRMWEILCEHSKL